MSDKIKKEQMFCLEKEKREGEKMVHPLIDTLQNKLEILAAAARYDVACTSSGSSRGGKKGQMGNTHRSGICHSYSSDGRCISLLKILLSNDCIYDCAYCANRRSNDIRRASFTPEEVCRLTMGFIDVIT